MKVMQVMHTKSDNVEIMNGTDTSDEKISRRPRDKSEGGQLNRGSSYIKSHEWIRNKGVTINRKNKDNKSFQYAITSALNHKNINHNPERISNLKPFINNCSWKDIEFPSHSKPRRKSECNNNRIALNILFVPYKKKHNKTK